MKQLTQKLKDGQVRVLEVPWPVLSSGQVLVQNHYSVISAGTESSTVSAARKSLVGKAKERPQQVKQVIDVLQAQGPVQTYRAVMKKLESYSPMGYSSAGTVVDVAPDVRGFNIGDKVACAGVGYASHAELVAIPQNLCVKLDKNANLEHAAYNTVGAIAMQGIRQTQPELGETCVVIGLGLIGQLTCVLLQAAGVRVIGLDIRDEAIERAQHCTDLALSSTGGNVLNAIEEFTNGIGADAVIITAATSSTEPINLAGKCLRHRGRVVIVGNVPTDFERETFYRKEIELKMSCSYGPGRYDPRYEEQGHDYPVGYVRWTEKRNMEAFQNLLVAQKMNLDFLTTHRFQLDDAPNAYDIILGSETPYCGIIINYDVSESLNSRKKIHTGPLAMSGDVRVGFIGAGSYAMNHLLPNVTANRNATLKGVMTSRGTSSRSVAERYGFEFCTAEESDLIDSPDINTLFIATRHDSHASYTQKALEAGKHVFVEKPLCLNQDELQSITETLEAKDQSGVQPRLMVGFNRRFSPLTMELKEQIGEGPMSMIYRINAGTMDKDAWMQIEDIGGGRIIGEGCHFIDYLIHINGSLPIEVFASNMKDPDNLEDVVSIHLRFENGSTGSVFYFSNGSKKLAKEYIEVFRNGKTAIIDDFKKLTIYGSGKPYQKKLMVQDKGQPEAIGQFIDAIQRGNACPIPFEEIRASMQATFFAIESMRTSKPFSLAH